MKNTLTKHKYKIFLILFILSLIVSTIISVMPIPQICDPNKGCDIVLHSTYAFTFKIKNSHYGITLFAFLSTLTFLQIKKPTKRKKLIINSGIIIGSLIAIYFLYIQQFVLKAYCKYCLVIDISLILTLILLLITWKR